MNWKLWIYGLLTGIITGAATAASNALVLPAVLDSVTFKKLLIIIGLNALVAGIGGGLAYLKTHPAPEWDGINERRNGLKP